MLRYSVISKLEDNIVALLFGKKPAVLYTAKF